jgi:hypothetical protein
MLPCNPRQHFASQISSPGDFVDTRTFATHIAKEAMTPLANMIGLCEGPLLNDNSGNK